MPKKVKHPQLTELRDILRSSHTLMNNLTVGALSNLKRAKQFLDGLLKDDDSQHIENDTMAKHYTDAISEMEDVQNALITAQLQCSSDIQRLHELRDQVQK